MIPFLSSVCIQVIPAPSWNNWHPFPNIIDTAFWLNCSSNCFLHLQPQSSSFSASRMFCTLSGSISRFCRFLSQNCQHFSKDARAKKWGGRVSWACWRIHVKQRSTTTGLSGESICAMSLALPKLLADSNSSASGGALLSPGHIISWPWKSQHGGRKSLRAIANSLPRLVVALQPPLARGSLLTPLQRRLSVFTMWLEWKEEQIWPIVAR